MKSVLPSAVLTKYAGLEMVYSISNQLEFTRDYEKAFGQLEAKGVKLGIESMGLSDTTLEEIFIKLAEQPELNLSKSVSWI